MPPQRLPGPFDPSFERVSGLTQSLKEVLVRCVATCGPFEDPLPLGQCEELKNQLQSPLSIFVCGEFNTGKSTVINAIAGAEVATVGILPTTRSVQTITAGPFMFVDSPGTNSIVREHEAVTRDYLHRADVVLFVTSVERPLSESEVGFLSFVKNRWKRKLLVAINKVDLCTASELTQVRDFVSANMQVLLGELPPIFLISAKQNDGVANLVAQIHELFKSELWMRTKLEAPLQAMEVIANDLEAELLQQQQQVDLAKQKIQETIVDCQRRAMEAHQLFGGYSEQGRAIFHDLGRRFNDFIDDRLGVLALLRSKLFRSSQNLKNEAELLISESDFEGKLNEIVTGVAAKLSTYRQLVVGEVQRQLKQLGKIDDRGAMTSEFSGVQREKFLNSRSIADDLRASAQRGMAQFFSLSSAAAMSGVGAKISTVAPLEITAVVMMFSLGVLSVRVVPREKRRLKVKLREMMVQMGDEFARMLTREIDSVLHSTVAVVEKELTPGRTSLDDRQKHLVAALEELNQIKKQIRGVRTMIDASCQNLSSTPVYSGT